MPAGVGGVVDEGAVGSAPLALEKKKKKIEKMKEQKFKQLNKVRWLNKEKKTYQLKSLSQVALII